MALLEMKNKGMEFRARVWMSPDTIERVEAWVDELEPVDPAVVTRAGGGSGWVEEYIYEAGVQCVLDHMFGAALPEQEKNWQVLLCGKMNAYRSFNGETEEWDEDMTVDRLEFCEVPQQMMDLMFGQGDKPCLI